ncbi:hypothetical protein LY76DRAFT_434468 [Colletotrichum caudatum]|nr:hypothetical protein LY76DRAFT_434468 [Colletotrichum caudatum]
MNGQLISVARTPSRCSRSTFPSTAVAPSNPSCRYQTDRQSRRPASCVAATATTCCPAFSIHLATASSTCLSSTCIPHQFTDTQHPWTRPCPGPPSWAWSLLALYRRRPFYFSVPSQRGAQTPPVPLDPRPSCPIYEYLYQLYSLPHSLLPTHPVLCFSSVLFPLPRPLNDTHPVLPWPCRRSLRETGHLTLL